MTVRKERGYFPKSDNIYGWGVMRNSPWHLAGIYEFKSEAEARAKELGPGYEVGYGVQRIGTDDFMFESPESDSDHA